MVVVGGGSSSRRRVGGVGGGSSNSSSSSSSALKIGFICPSETEEVGACFGTHQLGREIEDLAV